MSQLTFIDKIEVLGKLLISSPAIIGIFAFSLVLMIVLFLSNKLNKKVIKIIFIVIYLALFGFTIFKYGGYFLTSIDSFITIFMANIYFPTIPVYVFIMIISFIIMIFTFKSKTKIIKIVNVVFFTLIQMLFVIFIFIVETTKIDVSSNQNIYTNEQTLTLLELGMGLFVVWIIALAILIYLKKADKIFKTKKEDNEEDFDEYINDYIEPTNMKKAKPKRIGKKQKNQEEKTMFNDNSLYQYNSVNGDNKYDPANYSNGQFDGFNAFTAEQQMKIDSESAKANAVKNIPKGIGMESLPPVNTVPVQNSAPVQNSVPVQNVVPVQNSVPVQSTVPVQNSVPVQSTVPVQNTTSNVIRDTSSNTLFDNFEFIDVKTDNKERKNDDAEIIDFDL